MFDRPMLKEKAKIAFKRNYWACVGVAFLLTLAIGSSGGGGSFNSSSFNKSYNNSYDSDDDESFYDSFEDDEDLSELMEELESLDEDHGDNGSMSTEDKAILTGILGILGPIFIAVFAIVFLLALAITIFVKNPLVVGCRRYFVINSFEKPEFSEVGYGFRKGQYMTIVKTMFMKQLMLFLWSLPMLGAEILGAFLMIVNIPLGAIVMILGMFAIIPYIIKLYEYYMFDYIISEDCTLDYKTAIEQSKQMMDGNKWAVFVMELSFLGWYLLSILTCGILSIFYVNPYAYASYAELFLDLREKHFGQGVKPYYVPSFAGGMGGFNNGGYTAPQFYNPPAQPYDPRNQYDPNQAYTTGQQNTTNQYSVNQPYNVNQQPDQQPNQNPVLDQNYYSPDQTLGDPNDPNNTPYGL